MRVGNILCKVCFSQFEMGRQVGRLSVLHDEVVLHECHLELVESLTVEVSHLFQRFVIRIEYELCSSEVLVEIVHAPYSCGSLQKERGVVFLMFF